MKAYAGPSQGALGRRAKDFRSNSMRIALAFLSVGLTIYGQRVITTVAGTDYVFPNAGESALNVLLLQPSGVAADAAGNIYVSDSATNVVLKITQAGVATVFAGNGFSQFSGDGGPATLAGLSEPSDICFDSTGNLYIADSRDGRIRRVDPNGIITTVAGSGSYTIIGDNGPATEAGIDPTGIAVDLAGNLYIAEYYSNLVRRVDLSGTITTYAAGVRPDSIAVDAQQNLYIADYIDGVILKVTPQGSISTFAGGVNATGSYTSGPAVGATISPFGLTVGPNGTVYFTAGGYIFQVNGGLLSPVLFNSPAFFGAITVDHGGKITVVAALSNPKFEIVSVDQGGSKTVASSASLGTLGDGGPALSAYLEYPTAIAVDNMGGYYIADSDAAVVRYVNAQGIIQTVAGTGTPGFSGDNGPATTAQLSSPTSVAVDHVGNLYISDAGNHLIRRVSQGIITTYIGGTGQFEDTAPIASAVVGTPAGLAISPAGELFFADTEYGRVRRVTGGNVVTYAGNGLYYANGEYAFAMSGTATSSPIGQPAYLAFDAAGDLYLISHTNLTGGAVIYKITPQGALTLFAGTGVVGLTKDGAPAFNAPLDQPIGITVDPSGSVYFTESAIGVIRVVGSDGILRTAAGTLYAGYFGGDGGPAPAADLNEPMDVKSDAAGNLFIADTNNHRIREVLANAPSISLSATSLTFEAPSGGAPTLAQSVAVTGSIPGVQFTAAISPSAAAEWLIPNYSAGAAPLVLTFVADPTSLAAGTYPATITINAPLATPASQTISVTLVVDPGRPPTLQLDKNSVSFGFPKQGSARSQLVQVKNVGGGALGFAVTMSTQSGGQWLSVTPTSGTANPGSPALLTITANPAGLQTGTYQGSVTVSAGGQSQTVVVVASVSALSQAILLGQAGISYLAVSGGGIVPPQSFGVYNTGTGVMSWNVSTSTVSGGDWLQATPNAGRSDASSPTIPRVTVTVSPAGLAPGRYYGLVRVTSESAANSPQVVTATLEVLPAGQDPGAVVQPTQLNFSFAADFNQDTGFGTPGAQIVTIYDLSAQNSNFVAQVPDQYREVLLAPFTSTVEPQKPAQVVVQPVYPFGNKTLTIQFSDGTFQQIPITYGSPTSGAQGIQGHQASPSGCTPQKLVPALSAIGELASHVNATWPTALSANVMDDCGQPQSSGSVTVSFSNGDPPVPLQSSNDGNWEGTWQNSYGDAGQVTITIVAADPSRSLSGSSQAVASLIALQEPPVFAAAGVVNNADPVSNVALGLGSIVSIYGNQLAVSPASFVNAPLPTTLGATRVFIGGEFAPLYFASPTLINLQIPYDIQPDTIQQIVIQQGNTLSIPVQVNVAQAQPASFLNAANGPAAARVFVLRNGTGFVATPSAPAQAGDELILYCSGLGSVGQFTAGQIAPLTTDYSTQNPVTVTIGGVAITPDFAGLAPTFVGLYQVNVKIPPGIPSGSAVPMTIQVLNLVSPPITIPIQ